MIRLITIIFIFSSCSDFLNTWDGYEIKQGEHYSQRSGMGRRLVSLTSGRHLHFKSRFTSSCLYDPENDDINKLYGFTDAYSGVHQNSVRFGWRHDGNGTIEIFAYWYADGERGFQKVGNTIPDIEDDYEIWARNGTYYFKFNDTECTTKRFVEREHGIRSRLFPYFGGTSTAPNDTMIFIYEYD